MRPLQLELQGFASFREATDVDLEDAELFVLSGPTGSGKSSLIDAMIFALYGSVPRYDDRRLVAPVITQGQLEAKVRFTFAVEGARYTATRVVRRTRTGATTKEARLERVADDGAPVETVAGSADELSGAVERLLGLTFEHFTKTVVLPQGAFQEFLHAKPKERQDLLVELLDLDVYRRIAARARERGARADSTAALLRERLSGELAEASDEAVAQAKERVGVLEDLEGRLDAATPELEELVDNGKAARRAAEEAAGRVEALRAVTVPDDVAPLAAKVDELRDAVTAAREAVAAAERQRRAAEATKAELPDPAPIRRALDLLARRGKLATAVEQAATALAEATTAAGSARTRADELRASATQAARHVEELQRRHTAHTLAETLDAGDDCPVCRRTLDRAPDLEPPADLEDARRAAATAGTAADAAERDARTAEAELARATTAHEQRVADLQQLTDELTADDGALPDPAQLQATLDAVAGAGDDVEATRRAEDEARRQQGSAEQSLAAVQARIDAAWRAFDTARDRVATLEPPAADRDDLAAAWEQLASWAAERRPELETAAAAAEQRIRQAETDYRRRVEGLRADAIEVGIEVPRPNLNELVRATTAGLAEARARQAQLERAAGEAQRARTQLAEAEREAGVAKELGRLLNARNFEQWLLQRALRTLLVGASSILRDLSRGAYSLAVADDGGFSVIDHRNADERRPARTLSGGETFLASLALALALAEHVAELAAHGSARLDALFLDEGFGTLDADTLDTVAAAIEELGARGRTIGLVTHVRELAERVPVRFEVRRTATTSTVTRVDDDGAVLGATS